MEQIIKELPDFGDYVRIEQKRYGVPNEFYRYKVICNLNSNSYREVPVNFNNMGENIHPEIVPCIKAICCGVGEDTVEKFRVSDCIFDI